MSRKGNRRRYQQWVSIKNVGDRQVLAQVAGLFTQAGFSGRVWKEFPTEKTVATALSRYCDSQMRRRHPDRVTLVVLFLPNHEPVCGTSRGFFRRLYDAGLLAN